MGQEDWLEIVNLDKLVDFSRKVIFYNFDETNDGLNDNDFMDKIEKIENKDCEELERLLPKDEVKAIFADMTFKKKNKNTKKISLFIKQEDYDHLLSQLNQRMVSNIVKGLVSRGVVESAFDSDKNDFVFWIKKDNEQPEKPETD